MPYIYKYIDKHDDVVKYVGLIRSDSNFPKRFVQHERDDWFKQSEWTIEYAQVESICDAEALEGHFIAHYHTYEHFNKAKATWGELSFAPKVEWKRLENMWISNEWSVVNQWALDKQIAWAQKQLSAAESQIVCIQNRLDGLYNMVYRVEEKARKDKFEDIRNWIRSRLESPYWYDPRAVEENVLLVPWVEAWKDFCSFLGVPQDFVDFEDFKYFVEATTIMPQWAKTHEGIIGELRKESEGAA